MEPREVVRVKPDAEVVGCDGGAGGLGHPLVYLRFEDRSAVDCYYCSRRFAKPAYFETHTPAKA